MMWSDLAYWSSPEWQIVQEKLDAYDQSETRYNPIRSKLFAALDSVTPDMVKVCIVGQDPYPNPNYATGFAFSIPSDDPHGFHMQYPPTLHNIFVEYQRDLGYPYPSSGNLGKWVDQGVLLWNAIPSCEKGKSLSHDWPEWAPLTEEIVSSLDCVFVFLGGVARRYAKYADGGEVLELSHPSPRASAKSFHPFMGSRMFSTVNSWLCDPVDWRLP